MYKAHLFVLLGFFLAVLSVRAVFAQSGSRDSRCYQLDERGKQFLDQAEYELCLFSPRLSSFPRSVVTVVLKKVSPPLVEGRSLASVSPVASGPDAIQGLKLKPQIVAKRHYAMLGNGKFGRSSHKDKPQIIFDAKNGTVSLGFVAKDPKSFYFRPVITGAVFEADLTQHQTRQLDTLGSK